MKTFKFRLFILLVAIILGGFQHSFAQVDNLQKNSKIAEEAEATYNKDLKDNPNSALPHWRYANVMAAFTFNAYKNAWKYYIKALDIDSTTADIYYDFSNYLAYKLDEVDDAKAVCRKGLKYVPNNEKLQGNIKKFDAIIARNNEIYKLYLFDKTDKRFIQHDIKYAAIANFDSLGKVVTNAKSSFSFEKLLNKFNNNKSLTNYEVYLLLIGYTKTEHYNPYNYKAIDDLYELAGNEQIDEAIKTGEALLITNPLNTSLNRVLMFCYRKKGDTEKAQYYHKRILTIFDAMLFTGNGTCEKPYVTFWVKEEYNFARYINNSPTGEYTNEICAGGMVDKLETINANTDEKELIYFNIMPILNKVTEKGVK